MTHARLCRGFLVVAGAFAARSARAQIAAQPIDLDYRASDGCPTEATFVKRLRERIGTSERGAAGDGPRRISVAVEGSAETAAGRLTIVEPSGETTAREISGQGCEQIVDALAFVTALALDPGPPAEVAPVAPPSNPPQDAPSTPAPAADVLAPSGLRWRLSGAVHAGMTDSVTPGVELSAPVLVELGGEAHPGAPRRWMPSVRVGFERGFGTTAQVSVGSAHFTRTVGHADFCAAWSVASKLTAGPCGGVEMGELEASGSIARPLNAWPLWFAFGALARGRWQVETPVFLEIEAGAVLPVIRDTFYFAPQSVVYTVPPLGLRASGGAGLYFW